LARATKERDNIPVRVDVAHRNNALKFSRPGEEAKLGPQSAAENRAEGNLIAKAAQARIEWNKTHPDAPLYVRPSAKR
jgi:hypothetical protein